MDNLIISIIQTHLHWQDIDANLQHFEEKIASIKEKTHLIVLPEMFTTGFTMNASQIAEDMNGKTIAWFKTIAKQKNVCVTGSVVIKENDNYFNRLIWMQPDGVYYTYDKRHLFSLAGEEKIYTAGNKKIIVQIGGWKINLNICYDLRFPVWMRQQKNNLYDLNLIVANWPQQRIFAWDNLLISRSIENLCYTVACNRIGKDENNNCYNGHSQVVDPLGNLIWVSDIEENETILLSKSAIQDARAKFNFLNDADDFLIQ